MGERSLADHASANPPLRTGYQAWIESIPEWTEILEGWQARLTQVQIRRWLIEERGYDGAVASRSRIAHLSKQYPRTNRVHR